MDNGNSANYNHLYKGTSLSSPLPMLVVLVGDAGVGKTHLLNRYGKRFLLICGRYVKGKLP